MPKRSSKKKTNKDANVIAADIVKQATNKSIPYKRSEHIKNPAAVALGRLGGKKGGRARAEKLSSERRRAIAQKAARVRWNR